MRIKRVAIDRFGTSTSRVVEMGPGLTVIYGRNESGKTTMMEFIRSTLVPSSQRNVYPKRARTDSGRISVDDDGVEKIIMLEGRSRKGDIPLCIASLDPHIYRSVFAMNQSDLECDDSISSGEIRSRFLVLPGGDAIPAILSEIDREVETVVGRSLRSNTPLLSIIGEINTLDGRIDELRAMAGEYGELSAERDRLLKVLKDSQGRASNMSPSEVTRLLYQSNAGNFEDLTSLESTLSRLEDEGTLSPDAEAEYRDLSANERSAYREYSECMDVHRQLSDKIAGIDLDVAISIYTRLEALPGRLRSSEYHVTSTRSDDRRRTSRKGKALVALGALTASAGALASSISLQTMALIPIGIIVVLAGIFSCSTGKVHTTTNKSNRDGLDEDVRGFMDSLGLASKGLEQDIAHLYEIGRSVHAYVDCRSRSEVLRSAHDESVHKLTIFLDKYGGNTGFKEHLARTEKARETRSLIDGIRRALTSSGLDPDVRECPIPDVEASGEGDLSSVSVEIGRLEARMASIMGSDELETLLDRREILCSRRDMLLKKGAEAFIMRRIVESACDDAYSSSGSGVVRTANRFISMMTGGRYSMDNDPRETGISVHDRDGSKSLDRCSTGLRSQVMLSLKLAIARELGKGEVPMILDDVLLSFDSERKAGAFDALKEISDEMQVILFTCDDSVRDLATDVTLVEL